MDNNVLFETTIKLIEVVYSKLIQFLNKNERIDINNAEFFGVYNKIFECTENDISQHNSPEKSPNKRFNLEEIEKKSIPKNEEKLFQWVEKKAKEFIKSLTIDLEKLDENKQLEEILSLFSLHWDNFLIYQHWINKLFDYLNRFHLNQKKTNINTESHKILKEFYFDLYKDKLIKSCIDLIHKDRNDEQVPTSNICKTINAFLIMSYEKSIKIEKNLLNGKFNWQGQFSEGNGGEFIPKYYQETFEEELNKQIVDYYKGLIKNCWFKESTPVYVNLALRKLNQEENLADKYYEKSKLLIIKNLEKSIILDNSLILASNETSGVKEMLEKRKFDELKNIYCLFKRVPDSIIHIANSFKLHIEKVGNSFSQDPNLNKNPLEYIKKIISLKLDTDSILINQFGNDLSLEKARDSAFRNLLNNFDRSTRFLAMYSDNELKRGIKGLSEDEIETILSHISAIFRYLYSRDSFLKDYTRYLASRLLNESSLSNEAEKTMLTKLKTECGQTSVSKIMKMREDIEESKITLEDFSKNLKLDFDFQIKILTNGCWPEFADSQNVVIPIELKSIKEKFEVYYNKKHNGSRFLTWIFTEGSAEIIASYSEGKKYQFILSNIQLFCLLSINYKTEITLEMLSQKLGIQINEINIALENLFSLKILKKIENENNKNYIILLNKDFSNQSKRIICNIIAKKAKVNEEVKEKENNNNDDNVLREERINKIDAAVVRVMKWRKTLKLNEIMSDVVKILTLFRPQPSDIKSRIESLIERGYIRRDDIDLNIFIYVP